MTSFPSNALWDLSLPPTLPALGDDEFIALLQKQFGVPTDILKDHPNGSGIVNPQNLTRYSLPSAITPPSEDSSPSPDTTDTVRSRRHSSGHHTRSVSREHDDDPALKRKASDEDLDDEPSHKSQHTPGSTAGSSSKKSSSSRRKSTGNPAVDESRLLKRKEQNRAAQRAFRERKEKHVKDLEDKVAALEERNSATLAENDTLREVISRLQSENLRLRESSFTFTMPSTSAGSSSSSRSRTAGTSAADLQPQDTPMSLFGSPPSATSSATASTHDSPQSLFLNEKGEPSGVGAPISFFDRQRPREQTATADAMGLDFGFGPVLTETPYTTIASNPMFMSFREPDPAFAMETTPMNGVGTTTQPFGSNGGLSFNWPDVNMSMLDNLQAFDLTNSLDELFGGSTTVGNGAPMDYQSFKNLPTSQSPVSHQSARSPASTTTNASSPVNGLRLNGNSNNNAGDSNPPDSSNPNPCAAGSCPRTKASLAGLIAKDQGSIFVPKSTPPPTTSPVLPTSEFVPCSNLQLPKTQKSDKNVEVMNAWKIIQANPKFQDIDINDLCAEFASKARCDGSQVVIEPDGMQQILEAVSRKAAQKQ